MNNWRESLVAEILNATTDDWVSIDQIYLSVRFEIVSEIFDPKQFANAHWRQRNTHFTFHEIAVQIKRLVQASQLQARREDGPFVLTLSGDDVFSCWFHITDLGRNRLNELAHLLT